MNKKIIGLILSLIMVIGMVGCESKEEKQAKIVEKVRTKVETIMSEDNDTLEGYSYISNKQWKYVEDDNGDYVRMDGTFNYLISFDVALEFYINEDGTDIIKVKSITPNGITETESFNPSLHNL